MLSVLEKLTPEQRGRIVPALARIERALLKQSRQDAERLSSVVRVLRSGRDSGLKDCAGRTEVEMFSDFVRGIVRQELESQRS
jgi:hypothetical protein